MTTTLRALAAPLALAATMTALPALADDALTFQLSWRAQAEQGGYFQALAKGYWKACGLDVTIRQGGAGIDAARLLTSGAVDATLVSQNDGVMRMNQAGFPARAIYTSFQNNPTAIDVHADSGITSFEGLKGHPIFVAMGNRTTYWPYLQMKFGFADDQLRSFSGQFAPFLADDRAATQDFITNGPFVIAKQSDVKITSLKLSDIGYNPYSGLLTVSQDMIDKKPQDVACLVEGARKGWVDFMQDPQPAFDAISQVAEENSPELMKFSYDTMKAQHLVEDADTEKYGMGAMTNARWKAHFDVLVATGTFPVDFDYTTAYTLAYQPSHD